LEELLMKKNRSKLLAMLLALALALGMLAGCGSNTTTSASTSTTADTASSVEEATEAPEASEAEAPEADEAEPAEEASASEVEEAPAEVGNIEVELPIVDEAVHYSCWMPVAPYVSTMMDLDDFSTEVAMVKMINEATNVYIDFTAVAGGTVEEEAFNLMIAGGDYTDIIGVMNYYSTGHEGAIEDGIIVDLYDDLKEYAPNYWNLLTSDDDAYMTMRTESGYMGCIAQLLKKAGTENQGMIVRKDWLDASGVGSIETMDDMEEYLTYCKDTYGAYAYLQYEGLDTDFGSAFNISPGSFNVVDGEVIHSFTTQAFQDYLAKMNDWYTKGLFNDDFYNDTDITTVRTDMANDLCSFVDGSAEGMSNIFDMNPDNTAMELQAIAYPKADGVDEVHVGYESSLIKNSDTWAVSTSCGDYTDLLKLVNWLYSDEGQLMYNWGEEGVAFEYDANGDPQWTDLVVNNADGLNFMFASYLYATGVGSVYFPGVYDMEKGFYSYNDEQLEAVDVFADLTDGAYNLPSYVSLTLEETAEYNGYATDLDTYTEGMILKFIMGDEPLSNYDEFLETCMSMGLDRMTELYQTAYDRGQEALAELD
jgi:putative aldouronate transport system substrate-binding protein